MINFKEFKKTMASVLAMAMVFSPVASSTAFAADYTTDAATAKVASSGTTEGYVKEEAFCVTLPTTSDDTLKFKLDPQGLLSISGDGYEKYADVNAGDIVFTNKVSSDEVSVSSNLNTSNVFYATNKSSYDVTFSVDVSMTSKNGVKFVSNSAAVSANEDLNLYVTAVPEKNYISYNKVSASNFTAISSTPATADAFVISSNGTTHFAYKVSGNQDNYEISRNGTGDSATYTYVQKTSASDWNSVGFTITGSCNPNADWTAFNTAKTSLDLQFTWTITKSSGAETPITGKTADGLVHDATAYWDGNTLWVAVDNNNNDGGITSTALTSVKVSDKDGTLVAMSTYTFDSNWLALDWDKMMSEGKCTEDADAWTVEIIVSGTTYTFTV
jgi:hypothetical protein